MATARTDSAQAGPWGTGSTWVGGVVPTAAATILHSVTVDSATTIGESLNAGISGTGTVGTSGSSTTLTGSGTAFDTELRVGDIIIIGANQRLVTAIASATSLTMGTAATITAGTAFTYTPVALYMGGTGARLVINADLTVKGGLSVNYPSTTPVDMFTQANGTIVEFDSSGSPGTTATKYPIFTMSANNQQWTWKMTAGAGRSVLRSKTGGGAAYFTDGGSVIGAWFDWSNADISRIGDSTNNFARVWLGSTANAKWLFTDVNLDSCGQIDSATAAHASASMQLNGVRITNSQHATYSLQIAGNTNNATTFGIAKSGTKYNYFDNVVKFTSLANVGPVANSVFAMRIETAATTTKARDWTDCWFAQTVDTWPVGGKITESVFHYRNTNTNPHWLGPGFTGTGTVDIADNAFIYDGTDSSGNHFVVGVNGTAAVYNFERNLAGPVAGGKGSGSLVSFGGTRTGMVVNVRRNTIWCDGTYAFEVGHLYSSVPSPNCLGAIESNLFIGGSASERYIAIDSDPTLFTDPVTPDGVDKNARYLIKATNSAVPAFKNQGNGYCAKFSTTPGTTDIDLDASGGPDFVGDFSGLSIHAQWDASLGGPGTNASAFSNLAAGTAGYTTAAFLAFFRAKATPNNQLLKEAGVSGVDIGAVAVAVADPPSTGGRAKKWFPMRRHYRRVG